MVDAGIPGSTHIVAAGSNFWFPQDTEGSTDLVRLHVAEPRRDDRHPTTPGSGASASAGQGLRKKLWRFLPRPERLKTSREGHEVHVVGYISNETSSCDSGGAAGSVTRLLLIKTAGARRGAMVATWVSPWDYVKAEPKAVYTRGPVADDPPERSGPNAAAHGRDSVVVWGADVYRSGWSRPTAAPSRTRSGSYGDSTARAPQLRRLRPGRR